MGAPSGTGRSAQARLQAAREATTRLCNALRCPSCQKPFGPRPMQSLVCGHTLCAACGDTARTSLAACPVSTCRMPARPVDLCEDRTVRDIAAAAVALRSAIDASPQSTTAPSPHRAPRDREVCVPDSDEEGVEEEDGVAPTPPPQMRVCMTGVESAVRVSAQHALRELGAVAVELDGVQNATVLLTGLDGRREFAARTRTVHYALAKDIPIVDVAWAEACSARNRWLPFGPFLASRPPKPSRPVFANVAVFVDCGTGILGTDVQNWLRSGGATVMFQGVGDARLPDETRLFVHVVPDLRRETHDIGPEKVVEQCEQRGITAVLRDVPWVSDCLVSRACPPAVDVLAETMGGTLADSMEEDVLVV